MKDSGSAQASAAGSSYGQIFRSTAFTGGASLINLGLNVARTKAVAMLLGPTGVGLGGVYTTIVGLASTVAGMGIGSSGVRQIAEAAGEGDQRKIARTACTLRRTSWVCGIIGALLLAVLSEPISRITFGDSHHGAVIAFLGLAVFFGAVSAGQVALIQGLRRIAELAQLNVLGALAGTLLGIPLIWWLGLRGIGPMLVIVPTASLLFSWWYARKVPVVKVAVSWGQTASDARALLGLGSAFMASGLMLAGVAYLIRLLVVRQFGLESAGHYTAAYTLSGIYAGFILQAMGADFYPRLTAVSKDHSAMNRLVNEQTEIALLLAVPGILGTLVFAPWVIHVFYAGDFDPAVGVLQWQVLGILGRIISWPMGFILLAKDMRGLFIATEIIGNALHVAFLFGGMQAFGLPGTGMAFAGMYLCYALLMVAVSWKVTRFLWSAANLQLLLWMLPLIAIVFVVREGLPAPWGMWSGAVATAAAGIACLKGLLRRTPSNRLGRLGFLARLA